MECIQNDLHKKVPHRDRCGKFHTQPSDVNFNKMYFKRSCVKCTTCIPLDVKHFCFPKHVLKMSKNIEAGLKFKKKS